MCLRLLQDARIEGGYENVPTRDIHMKQVNFDLEWHQFLRDYVQPVQKRVFMGYDSDVSRLAWFMGYQPSSISSWDKSVNWNSQSVLRVLVSGFERICSETLTGIESRIPCIECKSDLPL